MLINRVKPRLLCGISPARKLGPEFPLSTIAVIGCGLLPEKALRTNPDFEGRFLGLENYPRLEATMKHAFGRLLAIVGLVAFPAIAQESPEAQCSAAATAATGYTPSDNSGPDGSRARGAARGAAAGAAAGAVQNNQYDNAPDALKDANREDSAKSGAAAGMAVAGSRNRQDRRQDRKGEDAWKQNYDACMAKPK